MSRCLICCTFQHERTPLCHHVLGVRFGFQWVMETDNGDLELHRKLRGGVYDVLPHILWTSHFQHAQGFTINEMMLYQDSMSSILLEKNRQHSKMKQTKHMQIWYFYISDHARDKTITIKHCPTEEVREGGGGGGGDFFTKPLQGSAPRSIGTK